MIARGFKSVIWVGAVGSAALGCYMVSLRVATERADLAHVERQIVDAKRDIRSLQTELGTRGRLAQLEDWNSNVLALSAPTSNQFVKDGFALARLQTHEPTVADRTGEVRMASLDTGAAAPEAGSEAAAKPDVAADAPKPAKAAPAAPASETAVTPRIVRAVAAPAARTAPLVRRASFTLSLPAETPAQDVARPEKPQPAAHATRIAIAKPEPVKKVKAVEPTPPAKHDPRPALRTASVDRPKAAKPAANAHNPATLADAAAHPSSSGHRGGAQ